MVEDNRNLKIPPPMKDYSSLIKTLRGSDSLGRATPLDAAADAIEELTKPISMVLFCPNCGMQHIDGPTPTWTNPPHRSHQCQGCKWIWRPADVPTNGVEAIETSGKNDNKPPIQDRVYPEGQQSGFVQPVLTWFDARTIIRTDSIVAVKRHEGKTYVHFDKGGNITYMEVEGSALHAAKLWAAALGIRLDTPPRETNPEA